MRKAQTKSKTPKTTKTAAAPSPVEEIEQILQKKILLADDPRKRLLGDASPSPEWLVQTAIELVRITRKEGGSIGRRSILDAFPEAESLHDMAAMYLHLGQTTAKMQRDVTTYTREVVLPRLSKAELTEGKVTYLRACKIITGEEKPKRATSRVERVLGKPTSKTTKDGVTVEELTKWHAKYAKAAKTTGTLGKRNNALKKIFSRVLTGKTGQKPKK